MYPCTPSPRGPSADAILNRNGDGASATAPWALTTEAPASAAVSVIAAISSVLCIGGLPRRWCVLRPSLPSRYRCPLRASGCGAGRPCARRAMAVFLKRPAGGRASKEREIDDETHEEHASHAGRRRRGCPPAVDRDPGGR